MKRTKFQCVARGCDGCVVCEPDNQCDGCRSGLFKDVQGMHRDEDDKPVMVCQQNKYNQINIHR